MAVASKAGKEKAVANRILKNIPKTLEGQLAVLLRHHYANALTKTKGRRRNGDMLPLSAWMKGTHKSCKSKINAVTNNQAWYPYTTYYASTDVLVNRIAKRYDITLFQKSVLRQYLNARYRGQSDSDGERGMIGTANSGPIRLRSNLTDRWNMASENAFNSALEKFKLCRREIPLRAILDENITNILLLIQLQEVIKDSR